MSGLPLDLLNHFKVYAESDNMRQAADRLGMTQAALSIQLKKLESLLPMSPFGLVGKKKTLNTYGMSLYKTLAPQFEALQQSIKQVHIKVQNPEEQSIRIGMRRELFETLYSHFSLSGKLDFHFMPHERILEQIKNYKIDVAITHSPPNDLDVIARKIYSEGCTFICHKKWLKNPDDFNKSEFLKQTPIISYNPQMPHISSWLSHCQVDPKSVEPKIISDDWSAVWKFVQNGFGYSIIPNGQLKDDKNLYQFPIPSQVIKETSFYLIYHKGFKALADSILNATNSPR